MKQYRLGFLGFGNVGRALARLLAAKSTELRNTHGIEWIITGVATRRMGWRCYDEVTDVASLLSGTNENFKIEPGIHEWLKSTKPDVVLETISLNPENGQPAIDYLKASLEAGAHTISANKAPLVYAFEHLN